MKSKRVAIVTFVAMLALVGGVLIWIASKRVPETSPVLVSEPDCEGDARSGQCIRFPIITGNNLNGRTFTLPDDLDGDFTIVVVPFDRDQQVNAETWLPFAQELTEEFPSLSYYNIPIFPELSDAVRLVIHSGMNIAIRDSRLRDRTILVYLEDRDTFLTAMQIADVEQIQVFLLDQNGDLLWRGIGEFSDEQRTQLERVLSQVIGSK